MKRLALLALLVVPALQAVDPKAAAATTPAAADAATTPAAAAAATPAAAAATTPAPAASCGYCATVKNALVNHKWKTIATVVAVAAASAVYYNREALFGETQEA